MDELITAAEAARRLGVTRAWISRLCVAGRIPRARRIGPIWAIPVGAEIEELVRQRTREIPGVKPNKKGSP